MYVVALIGGLGAGKSTAGSYLSLQGVEVVDIDKVAKDLIEDDPVLFRDLTRRFGHTIVGLDGHIDRRKLAEVAFGSDKTTTALNELVHPAVFSWMRKRVADRKAAGAKMIVFEIPLFEKAKPVLDLFDEIVLIDTDEALRIERAQGRGMSDEDVKARIAAQATDDRRRVFADTVIVNNGHNGDMYSQLDSWLDEKKDRASH